MLRLLKLRPLLPSSLRTLTPTLIKPLPPPPPFYPVPTPHIFLHRLPVSGTPKGKARLKSIHPLKKKSFQKNKPKSLAFDPKAKGGPLAPKSRSLPLRLNAMLRRREARRQELGLLSKLLKRDLALCRAREGGAGAGPPMMGLEGMDLAGLGIVDADAVPRFTLTVEDGRRLAKDYSRVMMRWNRMRQAAEGEAMELRRAAVEAMPEELRRKALVPVVKRRKKVKEGVGSGKGKGAGKGNVKVMSGKKPGKSAGKKGGGKGGKKG